jgi:hypothetical protein
VGATGVDAGGAAQRDLEADERLQTPRAAEPGLIPPQRSQPGGRTGRRLQSAKLDTLVSTTEWITHITRASLHLEGAGVIRGVTGDEIMNRMAMWVSAIPS